jgi:hypothetical protein
VRQCWDPAEWILRRGVAVPRALVIATLSRRLKRHLIGCRSNDSFRGAISQMASTIGISFAAFCWVPANDH